MTIPFITTGLCLGHLFFLPWFDQALYDEYHYWPYFTFLFSIVVTASTISIIKLGNGKYIFEHFVYLFVASILFMASGILFVLPTKRKFYFRLTHSLKMSIMHKYMCVAHQPLHIQHIRARQQARIVINHLGERRALWWWLLRKRFSHCHWHSQKEKKTLTLPFHALFI